MMRKCVVVGLIACAVACGEGSRNSLPSMSGSLGAGTGAAVPSGGPAAGSAGASPLAKAAGSGAGTAGSRARNDAGVAPAAGGGGGAGSGATDGATQDDAGVLADSGTPTDGGTTSDEDAATSPPECPDCCPDGFPRGKADSKLRKLASFTPSPEGVAVCPNGEVFVALDGSGELWRVPIDAKPAERWARLGDRRPAGLACDAQGRLFVAIFSTLSGASSTISVMLVTGRDADPIALPQPDDGSKIGGLNGIVAVPGIGVYASDSSGASIVLARESAPGTFTTRVVARDLALANGLAYDAANRTLYAVASGAGQLVSFPVADDGALGKSKQVSVGALILFMDGVTVDERGTVYVADYLGGRVIRAKDGVRVAPAAGGSNAGLANPASFDFRGGTLLITDYHVMAPEQAGGLYAIDLGVCGARLRR